MQSLDSKPELKAWIQVPLEIRVLIQSLSSERGFKARIQSLDSEPEFKAWIQGFDSEAEFGG